MTQFLLLYQLRERLRLVNERIKIAEIIPPSGGLSYVHALGQITELRSEAAFLADLIAQIEREEVQP